MKFVFISLAILSFQMSAFATCKASIQGQPKWAAQELSTILAEKGYQILEDDSLVDQVIRIESSEYAWSDGTETFSYAVPKIENKTFSSECPAVDEWSYFCSKEPFHKRAAIKCMLNKVVKGIF